MNFQARVERRQLVVMVGVLGILDLSMVVVVVEVEQKEQLGRMMAKEPNLVVPVPMAMSVSGSTWILHTTLR